MNLHPNSRIGSPALPDRMRREALPMRCEAPPTAPQPRRFAVLLFANQSPCLDTRVPESFAGDAT
jgi:hypothetical protein